MGMVPAQAARPASAPSDVPPTSEEREWQERMERARAAAEASLVEASSEETKEPLEPEDDSEQTNWEELMAKARARAEALEDDEETRLRGPRDRDTEMSASPVLDTQGDLAAAQVQIGARAANDDAPAPAPSQAVVSPVKAPGSEAPPSEASSEEDEWQHLKHQVESRELAEKQRKRSAIREIQRLQDKSRPRKSFMPSVSRVQRAPRRLATGTQPAPCSGKSPAGKMASATQEITRVAPEITRVAAEITQVSAAPAALPRVTQRLGRSS